MYVGVFVSIGVCVCVGVCMCVRMCVCTFAPRNNQNRREILGTLKFDRSSSYPDKVMGCIMAGLRLASHMPCLHRAETHDLAPAEPNILALLLQVDDIIYIYIHLYTYNCIYYINIYIYILQYLK